MSWTRVSWPWVFHGIHSGGADNQAADCPTLSQLPFLSREPVLWLTSPRAAHSKAALLFAVCFKLASQYYRERPIPDHSLVAVDSVFTCNEECPVSSPCWVSMDTSKSFRGGKSNVTVKWLIINVLERVFQQVLAFLMYWVLQVSKRCSSHFLWFITCCCSAVLRPARKANAQMSHLFLRADYQTIPR